MAEVPVGCGKEPSLNLTSEPPPSFVPKIRFSLQPWGGGGWSGDMSKAEQHHRLDNSSIAPCTHPPQGGSRGKGRRGSSKRPPCLWAAGPQPAEGFSYTSALSGWGSISPGPDSQSSREPQEWRGGRKGKA